jgi:hypothetical protein
LLHKTRPRSNPKCPLGMRGQTWPHKFRVLSQDLNLHFKSGITIGSTLFAQQSTCILLTVLPRREFSQPSQLTTKHHDLDLTGPISSWGASFHQCRALKTAKKALLNCAKRYLPGNSALHNFVGSPSASATGVPSSCCGGICCCWGR